jgi:hypothetical protein
VVDDAVDHGGGDDLVAEDVAPANWSWHMFVGSETACELGFPAPCVSHRSSRGNGVMLVTALTS